MNRRRTDILDVGEPTLDVGEQEVGETARRQNDRLPTETVVLRRWEYSMIICFFNWVDDILY